MRTFYGSDKKKREDAKRKKQEAKRLKRLNKKTSANQPQPEEADRKVGEPEHSI